MADYFSLRPFRYEEDYVNMAQILTASEQSDNNPRVVSGADLKSGLSNHPSFDIQRDLTIAEVAGQAVGYGRVSWSESDNRCTYELTGFVIPEWRHKGIGRAILSWQENRAQEIGNEQPSSSPSILLINATQYQVGVHALAKQSGFGIRESWILMVRPSLEDIPELPLPAGLEVRPALPEHFSAIWHAAEEAYVPDGGPKPTGIIPEDFRNSPNFQPELWQVAWEVNSGKVAGSVMTYINHAENKQLGIQRGYTEGISTVPAWQRHGVAKALIYRSLIAQRQAGCTESALVCSGENPDNYRLYDSCGFKEVKRDTVYEKNLLSEG